MTEKGENTVMEPRRLCTCETPPSVDITEAFAHYYGSSADTSPHNEQNQNDDHDDDHVNVASIQAILVPILQRYGWAIVTIDPMKLAEIIMNTEGGPNTPALLDLLNQDTASHQKRLQSFFSSSSSNDQQSPPPPHGIYRHAESGSSQAGLVEPKESWEVQRRHLPKNTHDSQHALYHYLHLLHNVGATVVETCLGFSSNTVLAKHQDESLDLMRAFYYHAVDDEASDDDDDDSPMIMGSSEHTDWGSLTVVWQDDIGGLETYCHQHERWNAVPVAPARPNNNNNNNNNNAIMSFVIHVSDATSLALARNNNTTSHNNNAPLTTWPSPRHRVVSPINRPRTSLVYFAYPPPSLSLEQLAQALEQQQAALRNSTPKNNTNNNDTTLQQQVAYEDYFLLRNQAASGHSISAQTQCEAIWKRPLKQVFLDKWQQVQRSEEEDEMTKDEQQAVSSSNHHRCLWKGEIQLSKTDTISYDALWRKYARAHRNHPSWLWHSSRYLVVVQEVSLSYIFFLFNQVSLSQTDYSRIQTGVDRSVILLVITLLLVVILNHRGQEQRPSLRQKARQRLTDAGLIGIVLKFLSNLLCSLTASYADDAVESLALTCMLLHLATVDYGYANGQVREPPIHHATTRPTFQGGTLSLNAAFLATFLWMSRLENQNLTAFSTCLLAVVVFAFFPQTRHELSAAYPPSSHPAMALITVLLVFACGNLANWTRSKPEVHVYLGSVCALLLIIPVWKAHLQSYKVSLRGPWDIAKLA